MDNKQYLETLEFNKILEMLSEEALTYEAKEIIMNLRPYYDENKLNRNTFDTTEARQAIEALGLPPISVMKDMVKFIESAVAGGMLLPDQLEYIGAFIMATKRLSSYLAKVHDLGINLGFYKDAIQYINDLYGEINYSIRGGRIINEASSKLKDIRRKKENIANQIKSKLEQLLSGKKSYFADSYVSKRNGRYVLPVKKEYKNQVQGTVVEMSQTGSTYFIEPSSVIKLSNESDVLEIDEMNEENRILYELSDKVANYKYEFLNNIKTTETLDFIFAKGKLSIKMKAVKADYNFTGNIEIKGGKHPLLDENECVPLDFKIDSDVKGVIITGPNTGGKTVSLKAIGLFSLMAQSGLHVPCEYANFSMFSRVYCDIGDNQSISENLSTFSAHIKNIVNILENADSNSLILLDELGSGTDPGEGMGIAIAILEELRLKQCFFVATTHYPEVKVYADRAEGILNARMAFDKESLKPLYRLEIGQAGESCALYIAKKFGLNKRALKRAYDEAYNQVSIEKKDHDDEFLDGAKEVLVNKNNIRITKREEIKINEEMEQFEMGDSVYILPEKKLAIVFEKADDKGNVIVMHKEEFMTINYKRLKINLKAEELYPPDYDFSIIFDSAENRKLRKKMTKRHIPGEEVVLRK